MTEAKTIKLLLSNGSLSGLLVAELLKWEGILLSSPRASYQLLSNEQESKFWGVYLLVSESKVYIGQANDLLRRISEHDKSKDWWEKVVLLTTKDNSLNRSDIDYLENKLIGIAKSRGTLEMSNIQTGNSPKVSRYRETELIDFLDGGLLLLELIGIKVFVKNNKKTYESNIIYGLEKIHPNNIEINYQMTDNKSFVKINKGFAIEYFKKNSGLSFDDGKVTFASLQVDKSFYWANPSTEFSKTKWYIILNNQIDREFTLLEIPANTFNNDKDSKENKLVLRKDKPFYFDIYIDQISLIEFNSKCDFSIYVKKVKKY